MEGGSWYLRAQKQYDEWSKEMVGIAVTGESLRIMLTLFVGPPPDTKMWSKLFKFFTQNGMLKWTGEFMPTQSGRKSSKLYEVLK
jgi:hypothetical protein